MTNICCRLQRTDESSVKTHIKALFYEVPYFFCSFSCICQNIAVTLRRETIKTDDMAAKDYMICPAIFNAYIAKVSKKNPSTMTDDRREITEEEILELIDWYLDKNTEEDGKGISFDSLSRDGKKVKLLWESNEPEEKEVKDDDIEGLDEASKDHAAERFRTTRNTELAEKCMWSFRAGAKWNERRHKQEEREKSNIK